MTSRPKNVSMAINPFGTLSFIYFNHKRNIGEKS
uniref:Uncharacterized protein n=1 Tax=Lepeophtheirus salmonis TaxID=72036 RepID=A0A0K2TCD2_LEPSM